MEAGAQVLWGWAVQPCWRGTQLGGPNSYLLVPTRRLWKRQSQPLCSTAHKDGWQHQIKTNWGSDQILGKTFSPWGQSTSGAGCPEVLCDLHPWRFPRADWTKPWATQSEVSVSCAFSRRLDDRTKIRNGSVASGREKGWKTSQAGAWASASCRNIPSGNRDFIWVWRSTKRGTLHKQFE